MASGVSLRTSAILSRWPVERHTLHQLPVDETSGVDAFFRLPMELLHARTNGIDVTAIHSHMLDDEPRAFFIHFWANYDAVKLAKGLRAGLDAIHVAPRG